MSYIPLHRDHERWQFRLDESRRQFMSGEISEDVHGANLYSLGFRGSELRTEINLHRSASKTKQYSAAGFVSGLPDNLIP